MTGHWSLELIGDLVEAGLGARLVLLAAGRAGYADRADDLVADLDRQGALRRDDPAEVHGTHRRIVLDALDELSRRDTEGPRSVGLALAVLHRMRRGSVAAHRDEGLAVAPEHMHRDVIALLCAGLQRGLRDRHRHRGGQALFVEQLRARRRCQRTGEADYGEAVRWCRHASGPPSN